MKAQVAVPVTVKCRIGIDEQDPEEALEIFAGAVERAGVDALIVHARKAWLKGLSPRQNRDVPPLDHARVHRLKAVHPGLPVVLNGGIASLAEAASHLDRVDGVMMGRAAIRSRGGSMEVDALVFGAAAPLCAPKEAAQALIPYIERELVRGTRLSAITRHMLGLFRGVPGARAFRRHLATASRQVRRRDGCSHRSARAGVRPSRRAGDRRGLKLTQSFLPGQAHGERDGFRRPCQRARLAHASDPGRRTGHRHFGRPVRHRRGRHHRADPLRGVRRAGPSRRTCACSSASAPRS